ncbi:RNA-guided endonuclease InsQ/TnpB family protein [Microcoleus sp. OTE_8_concoct_300]|uniref:RNA-guided endonuclease InsQ/TnpB family protein n=1 Tax=Microcoleus sp. OTE_8_concoct_300 TaxID=2964710 RepID=UPI00403F2BDB
MFALKRALKLNKNEATLMVKHAGFRRVAFNMDLSLRTQMYGEGKFSDSKVINEINKLLSDRVKKQPGFAGMNQLSSRVAQNALIDLKGAFSRYRFGQSGHPTFASRRWGQLFTVDSSKGKVVLDTGYTIKIPTLVGTFRLHEPWDCGLVSQTFTISKEGSCWFVSFSVDAERLPVQQPKKILGVDRRIKSFATFSEAEGSKNQVFEAPKPLKQAKTKLATLQRQASRQARGSNNHHKTYARISRLHAGIFCVRKDFLNKLTAYLAKSFKLIKIEDLNVKRMMANHKLAGAISDLGFYEFKRQLTYNCLMYMVTRVLVAQWFPSSLTCSNCGQKQARKLSIRTYNWQSGGVSIDRDLNASINILNREPSAARRIAY